MRRIGIIEAASQATRFCDYLVTQGIQSTCEPVAADASGAQDIWIKDERQVEQAKAALAAFLSAPDDPRYAVSAVAEQRRVEQAAENKRRLSNQQKVRHRSLPGATSGERPLITLITIAVCVVLGLFTDFGPPYALDRRGDLLNTPQLQVFDGFKFVSYRDSQVSDNPFASIIKGQVWRLITPALLHGSIGHLAMNMISIFILGAAIERLQGRKAIILLLVVTAVAGTVVQALWPEKLGGGPNAVGASGAGYGLFGYIWIRPLYDVDFMIRVPPTFLFIGVAFLLLGVTGVIHGIANGAHFGGLGAGMVLATLIRPESERGNTQRRDKTGGPG